MRAVVHDRYGPPEVLRIEEVERPVPNDGRGPRRGPRHDGHPLRLRLPRAPTRSSSAAFTGIRRPKRRIVGMELAGVVEAVGPAVHEFAVGDEVFGVTRPARTRSTSASARAGVLAHKPAGMSFEEAAAVCDGALHRALVPETGGSRATGRSIARLRRVRVDRHRRGAARQALRRHVTAVCNTKNVELVRSLGADEVHRLHAARTSRRTARRTTSSSTRSASTRSGAAATRSSPAGSSSRPISASCGTSRSLALATRWLGDKRVTLGDRQVPEGGRPPPQGPDRGGDVPGGHRPHVPARGRRRGHAVRRDRPEDRERRPDCASSGEPARMRAVVHDRYGPPEVLRLEDVERPVPAGRRGPRPRPRDDGHPDGLPRPRAPIRSLARLHDGLRRPKRTDRSGWSSRRGRGGRLGGRPSSGVGDEVFGMRGRCERGVRLRPRERRTRAQAAEA